MLQTNGVVEGRDEGEPRKRGKVLIGRDDEDKLGKRVKVLLHW